MNVAARSLKVARVVINAVQVWHVFGLDVERDACRVYAADSNATLAAIAVPDSVAVLTSDVLKNWLEVGRDMIGVRHDELTVLTNSPRT